MSALQEIVFPPEVAHLGQPLGIHRARTSRMARLCWCAGLFFLFFVGFFVFVYFQLPIKKNKTVPQEIMLYFAGGSGLLGLFLCWAGSRLSNWEGAVMANGYLVYPQALVVLQKGVCHTVAWNEITGLISPRGLGDYQINTRDGRSFPIKHAVKDYWNLIATVSGQVTHHVIHPMRDAIAAGQTVRFGPFEVSRQSLGYKGKTLPWDKVAALEFQNGQAGRRLRIRASGSFLPWCYANLESFPNRRALRRSAPHGLPAPIFALKRRVLLQHHDCGGTFPTCPK